MDKSLIAIAAMLYGLGSVAVSTISLLEFNKDTNPLKDRNISVFNQMAEASPAMKTLNDPARGENAWLRKQDDITYDIRSNGNRWNWTIIRTTDGGDIAANAMKQAKIALIPTLSSDEASLVVDSSHGCLSVPFNWSVEQSKDGARALLKEFDRRGGEYDVYGTYVLSQNPQDGGISYKPLQEGESAASVCPAPAPLPAAPSR